MQGKEKQTWIYEITKRNNDINNTENTIWKIWNKNVTVEIKSQKKNRTFTTQSNDVTWTIYISKLEGESSI